MSEAEVAEKAASPDADLRALDRLVGTWKLGGDTEGTVTYEWMEGGFFLIQRVDMTLFGHAVRAVEIIGHLRAFGEQPSRDIRSRAYDNAGNTLDYVYEMEGDTLTIWGGERGSPAYFKSAFDADGDSSVGAWIYPGGGGYASTMSRIPERAQPAN
jgi:hypothetical protein